MEGITGTTKIPLFQGHVSSSHSGAAKSHAAHYSTDTLRQPRLVEFPRTPPALTAIRERYKDLSPVVLTVSVRDAKARYPAVHMGATADQAWIKPNGQKLADSDVVSLLVALNHSFHSPTPETSLLAVWHPSSGLEQVKFPKATKQLQESLYPKLKNAGPVSRTIQSVAHRYYEYYHGAQETLGNPKGMGKVFPNLFSTSVGISMSAYGMLYVVQYTANLINLNRQAAKKLAKASGQALPATSSSAPKNASAAN